jgi:hypothetical protein
MNKKIFSIIAFGITVSCALATGVLAESIEFVRSGGNSAIMLDGTKEARNTSLRPQISQNPGLEMNILAEDENESIILIDNLPAFQDKISSYIVNDVDGDNYTWEVLDNSWDGYSYFQIYPYYRGNDLDDWIFIPFELPGSGKISLSMLAATSYSDGHNFQVCVGKGSTPSDMTIELAARENYGTNGLSWSNVQEPIVGEANLSEGGQYWLGIHATSGKDAYQLRIRNIVLTYTASSAPNPPAQAGDVFVMHPTEDEFASCTIIDGNNDGCTIYYDVHEGLNGNVYDWPIAYNKSRTPAATADADEWIITPAVTLSEINRIYTVSIEANPTTDVTSESFRIVMAKANDIESMRAGQTIMNEPSVVASGYVPFSSKFGITEPGDYYFGIHINSKLDKGWRLMLRDFKVTLTDISSEVPAGCTDLVLTPDSDGALQLTAGFTLPTTYINGNPIPATETIDADIVTSAETVTVSGHPGQSVNRTVKAVDGLNIVTVTAANANGKGMDIKGTAVCGIDTPTDPVVTSTVSDDNKSLILSWEPVATGANGGVVPSDGITYNIYQYVASSDMSRWVLIEEGLTECSYKYSVEDDSQQLYQLMVSAKNEKGESMGNVMSFAAAMLGKPHDMPVNETFPEKTMKYDGLLLDYPDDSYTADWALDSPAAVGAEGGPEYALMCLIIDAGNVGCGYVELPKISTLGCKKPRIRLFTYISSATPTTTIRIHSTEGRGNGEVLGVISPQSGQGWSEIIYDIPERYYNKNWIVISADVKCDMVGQVFILGEYDVYESVANDLALSYISMPSYLYLGEEAKVVATIQNRGFNPAATPDLKALIYADGEIIRTVDLTHTSAMLAENEKAEYTGKICFNSLEMAGRDYSVDILLPDTDADSSNNYAFASFRVGLGDLPVVNDLEAQGNENDNFVQLSWTDPLADGFVDKIESYAHGCYDYNLGDWKNIDFDMGTTYYSEGFDIPAPGTPKAFQAVNAVLSGIEAQGGMGQPSGDSFLMAFCPQGATADDWLISPAVNGGSDISFYITSLSSAYSETVEVMVSTTDDELDSFSVLDSFELSVSGWRFISATLPNDAKYFAIHYASTDMFGICVDDIAYSPVEAPFEITGWNIYRDGLLIKQNNPGTSFTDEIPDDEVSYKYNVAATGTRKGVAMEFPLSITAEYDKNASIESVDNDDMNISVEKGIIRIDGCGSKRLNIVDIRGISLYDRVSAPDKVTVRLEPGFYIVSIGGKSCKVMVP